MGKIRLTWLQMAVLEGFRDGRVYSQYAYTPFRNEHGYFKTSEQAERYRNSEMKKHINSFGHYLQDYGKILPGTLKKLFFLNLIESGKTPNCTFPNGVLKYYKISKIGLQFLKENSK